MYIIVWQSSRLIALQFTYKYCVYMFVFVCVLTIISKFFLFCLLLFFFFFFFFFLGGGHRSVCDLCGISRFTCFNSSC